MAHIVDRRTFLALLAMAGSAAAAPRLPKLGGKRVVVLGAGLAGLSAAWNLQKNGYDVTILEAQDIPGGRVKTIRKPFSNGCYAEAGALRIYDNHRWTRKYIRLMDLDSKLRAYDDDQGAHLWYLEGKRFVTPTAGDWPLAGLSAREKRNPFALIEEYWRPGFEAVGDATRPEYPEARLRELDRLTLVEFLKSRGATDAWIKVLLATEGNLGGLSALAVTALEGAPNDGPHAKTFGLYGGNDQLPKALAASLGGTVKYRTEVLKLAHDDDGVTVTVRNGSEQHEIRADHCVCALPFPVLRRVEIAPAFSRLKMDAIAQYGLFGLARVSMQTRTRFWRNDQLGPLGGLNMVGTDTKLDRIWNTSSLLPDPQRGMLHAYLADPHASEFARIPEQDRVAYCLRTASEFLPQLPAEVEAAYVKVWHEDPWQLGAIALVQPNQYHWIWPAARRAEGRVHFAGEHTSVWIGYMNGALESGERCAREIMSS
jgi:monoamine oxidase